MAYHDALRDHLQWWGLQHFETEDAYYRWQRERIGPDDLEQLNRLVEARRQPETVGADEAFYDLTARTDVAEVLYSQRYDYYMAIGPLISEPSSILVVESDCSRRSMHAATQIVPSLALTGLPDHWRWPVRKPPLWV
jgi:hypothetical protein